MAVFLFVALIAKKAPHDVAPLEEVGNALRLATRELVGGKYLVLWSGKSK